MRRRLEPSGAYTAQTDLGYPDGCSLVDATVESSAMARSAHRPCRAISSIATAGVWLFVASAAAGQHSPPSRAPGFSGGVNRIALPPQAPAGKVLRPAGLTKADFRARLKALRNEQLVEWQGRSVTKLAFLAEAGRRINTAHQQAQLAATEHRDSEADLADAEFSAARGRLGSEEAARLTAENREERQLAAPVGLHRAACQGTAITRAPSGALSPGRVVVLFGCGFGEAPGRGSAILRLGGQGVPLEVDEWRNDTIVASLPAALSQLEDQAGEIDVHTANQQLLVAPVSFRAARELRVLPAGDIQVATCDATADANYCNSTTAVDATYWGLLDTTGLGNPALGTGTVGAAHADDASPQDDEGTDRYAVHLKHGWTVLRVAFRQPTTSGTESASAPVVTPGVADQVLEVPWRIPGEAGILYSFDVLVIGPRGTEP
jgi:hypothetical protein